MSALHWMSLVAGACFGAWPLLMNRSGLEGAAGATVYCIVAIAVLAPLAIHQNGGFAPPAANWWMAWGASIVGTVGFILFNEMLSKAGPEEVNDFFMVMIIAQTSVVALNHVVVSRSITDAKMIGYLLAILAVYFLIRR